MEKLKLLEVKKLLKELDYVETDFEWHSEMISEADISFLKEVNKFLESNIELKKLYDDKIQARYDELISNKTETAETNNIIEEKETTSKEDKPTKVKKLYREIAKLTHPDKSESEELNQLYLKASEYYNSSDKIGIYKICSKLEIDYEIEEEDVSLIGEKIDFYKNKISFLENNVSWHWMSATDEHIKNSIVFTFIQQQL